MKKDTKNNLIGASITAVIGLILGFFGVIVSVFSDGTIYERLVTALVVLIIYAVLSLILGFMKSGRAILYMLSLSLPGVLLLLSYSFKEFNLFYIVYMVLILAIVYFGVKSGKSFKKK